MIFFDDFLDFTNWAWYRQGLGKYEPEDIDPTICTHVVYAFAVLDESKLLIKPSDTIVDRAFYQKITALKGRGVKVTIGLGGWSDSHNGLVEKNLFFYLVQLIEHPILRIQNFLFIYFLGIFSRQKF